MFFGAGKVFQPLFAIVKRESEGLQNISASNFRWFHWFTLLVTSLNEPPLELFTSWPPLCY